MTELNMNDVKDLAAKLDEVLAKFAKDNNLEEVNIKKVGFDSSEGEITASIQMITKKDKEELRAIFEKNAEIIGLNPLLFGVSFVRNNELYTVDSINLKNRKYPVICIKNGVKYKLTVEAVNAYW